MAGKPRVLKTEPITHRYKFYYPLIFIFKTPIPVIIELFFSGVDIAVVQSRLSSINLVVILTDFSTVPYFVVI